MKILGIGLSHCCGVCLIEDERIIFCQDEDRFSRRRRHKGWPEKSLAFLMEKYNLSESDIDLCVMTDIQTAGRLKRKINAKKTIIIHHQLAHIMSGWALIPWPDFSAVSLDGGGDFGSWLSFARIENRRLIDWESNCGCRIDKRGRFHQSILHNTPLKRVKRPGWPFGTYWSFPTVVNFGMLDKNGIGGYEGKLMGLAAYGDANRFDCAKANYTGRFELKKCRGYHYLVTMGHPKIGDSKHCITPDGRKVSLPEAKRLRKNEKIILSEYNLKHKDDFMLASDFAAMLQDRTNSAIEGLFKKNFKEGSPVVLTGGTFGNVVTNGLLNQKYKTFVTPPMGDDGLALGAAAWGAYVSGVYNLEYPGVYMGYDAGSNKGVKPEAVAELLADKKVVGLINGRMEAGPRALGARTILSDPQDNNVNYTINERLGRVEYMPFAPVILEEHASDVLIGWNKEHLSSNHMTLLYKVSPKWQQRIKGVVHIDGSVRPQVLKRTDNPFYYDILREYFKKTGIPVLINTSFNAHGEPMLRTVEEGINALRNNRVDALVAGGRLRYAER